MKRLVIGILVVLVGMSSSGMTEQTAPISATEPVQKMTLPKVGEEGLEWMTDFEEALKKAKEQNKPLLLDFTGSDWCGWCIKLKKEVFNQPEFKQFASNNFILVEIDFPMRKPQPPALKAQNSKLQAQFGIQGYPTIVLIDSNGKEFARTGYRKGGAASYVEHLQELLKKIKPK